MAYLNGGCNQAPVSVIPKDRPVEWLEAVGTWGILIMVGIGLWLEWQGRKS
jgi:hypothetical protein